MTFIPPDPTTQQGQLQIAHNQACMAISTLAFAVEQMRFCPERAKELLQLMDAAKLQVDQAHAAACNYGGMILPCAGAT